MLKWILLAFGIIVVLFAALYASGRRFRADKIARNTARTMLKAYYALESANPDTKKEDLYLKALTMRLTFNEETAKKIIEGAKESALDSGLPLRLWMVTLWAAMYEYENFMSRLKKIPGQVPRATELYDQFQSGVLEVIPEDI